MSKFTAIFEEFNKLSDIEKRIVVNLFNEEILTTDEHVDFAKEIKENRFSKGQNCPHCNCDKVVRNGKYNNVQRYLCKDCKKTFTDYTHSPSYNSKISTAKWIKYFKCMIEGYSIRDCAKLVKIAVPTAFAWRHKILDAIRVYLGVGSVAGVVEADETFFRISYKGGHRGEFGFKLPRKPFKRGAKSKPSTSETKRKRGISDQKVAVLCCIDRAGNIMSELSCIGRLSKDDAKRFFDGRIEEKSIMCTDSHNAYRGLEKIYNIDLVQVERGKYKKGIYHIQSIGAYHSKLKCWLYKFRGVSTKYLANYLYWNKWNELFKNDKHEIMYSRMMVQAHSVYSTTKATDFKTRQPIFI